MKEIIWITGASTGIGKSLAVQLAQHGHTIIASARGEAALKELSADYSNIIPLPFDVSDNTQIERVKEQLINQFGYIDRVIINAGTCEYFDVREPDWSIMSRVMNVNYNGAVNTVAVAMDLLKARPSGADNNPHIVAVVSQAAFVPFPRAEAYGASKAAMQYFMDSLRIDLVDENIDVTVINPGFIKTPLTDRNDFPMPFLMSSEQAAMRMVKAIVERKWQYDFPKRLKWCIKVMGLSRYLWNKVFAPQTKH